MFDVGWSELVVIGVVSLVVIGPKELPGVIRNVGRAIGKLRTMAGDFRAQFDEAMREADLADVQKTFTDAKDAAGSAFKAATNPVGAIKDEIVSSVTAINESAAALEADIKAQPAPSLADIDLPPPPEAPPVVLPVAESPTAARRRKKAEAEAAAPPEPAPRPRRVRKATPDEGAA